MHHSFTLLATFLIFGITNGQTNNSNIITFSIKKVRTEVVRKKKIYLVDGIVKNNSKDTLKYVTFLCNNISIFKISNDEIKIDNIDCKDDQYVVTEIDPRSTYNVTLRLYCVYPLKKKSISTKIGFNYIEPQAGITLNDFVFPKTIIWSNSISL